MELFPDLTTQGGHLLHEIAAMADKNLQLLVIFGQHRFHQTEAIASGAKDGS